MKSLILYDQQYFGNNQRLYPYTYNDVNKKLARLGINNLPFNLIDKSMGITECQVCKSRYAGYQEKCTHSDYFWMTSIYSLKFKTRKECEGNYNYSNTVYSSFTECGSTNLKWSLAGEYNKQSDFFSAIDRSDAVISCSDVSFTGITEWEDALPLGTAEAIENKALKQKIVDLEYKLEEHRQAIKEIIDRMQQAGSSLLNGVF